MFSHSCVEYTQKLHFSAYVRWFNFGAAVLVWQDINGLASLDAFSSSVTPMAKGFWIMDRTISSFLQHLIVEKGIIAGLRWWFSPLQSDVSWTLFTVQRRTKTIARFHRQEFSTQWICSSIDFCKITGARKNTPTCRRALFITQMPPHPRSDHYQWPGVLYVGWRTKGNAPWRNVGNQ